MNHGMYLEMMRGVLDMHAEATEAELNDEAIRTMRDAGFEVTRDRMPDHRFRVRVKGPKESRYNVCTTSTSGYPVLTAFGKYLDWKEGRA